MTEATTNCVICTTERASAIGYLCIGHHQRFADMLREVEDEVCRLDARPSMQQQTGSSGGTLASHRTPVRLDVLVHNDPRSRPAGTRPMGPACITCWHDTCADVHAWLDAYDANALETLSIIDVLGSWARLVREERDLTPPAAVTVSGERDLLTRQLDWIAEQPWVDEAYGDVRTLLGQLRITNGTGPDKPHCRCPVILEGEFCRGNVWVHDELQPVWRRYPDRCAQTWEQAPGAAVCDTCGSSWVTEADKARLKRMTDSAAVAAARPVTEDGRPMLTAEELVAKGHVSSVNNVRVRAHRLGIVSVDGHYDPAPFLDKATA